MPLAPSLRGERVRVPTHILWGDRDAALTPELADEAAALCDQVRVTHFEDATHWLHHEEPARVSKELANFLAAD